CFWRRRRHRRSKRDGSSDVCSSDLRLWEMGVGALVAIGARWWGRLPRVVGVVLGWVGLVAVVASGVLLSTEVAWPGYAAAWPVRSEERRVGGEGRRGWRAEQARRLG